MEYKMKDKKRYEICFCLAFFLSLVMPVMTLNTDKNSMMEQRRLADAPMSVINEKLNPRLAAETEAWLRDRFGFRDFFLRVNSRAEAALRVWNSEKALLGKEGWLFYKGENSVENFFNHNLFSQQELETIRDGIRKKQAMLKAEGTEHYYLLICPDKNQLYGEAYYPDRILSAGLRGEKSRAQQLTEFLKASGDINVIYPLDAMLKEKKDHHDHFLYYRTDTHWNSHGAFIAYKELMAVIQKDYPDFKPLTDEDFYLTKSNPEPGCDEDFNGPGVEGDLLRMFPGRTITDLEIKNNYVDKLVLKEGTFKYKFLKFAGEEGRKGIVSDNKNKKLKVVMYRDSFGRALVPFIAESFNSVDFVWTHNFAKNFGYVKRKKPDIVIEQIVERSIIELLTNVDKK